MSESHIGIPLLQPFCFTNPGKWSDGFNEHGIFEIVGLDELTGRAPKATVRRIASFKIDCVIGEVVKIPTHRIKSRAVRTSLQSFSEHADFDQLTAAQSRMEELTALCEEKETRLLAAARQIAELKLERHERIDTLTADNQRLRTLITTIYDGIHRGVGPMSEASDMEVASEIHETMCGLFGNEWREES